ncbi:ArnT family glycosyltransferase [Roseixanthobacter liquoris]|uniref:ArnT family glycosyltransferase n=1 Tax=Roseixanthobacter liquoris TaxID=3119921 RepID=UPI00372BDE64
MAHKGGDDRIRALVGSGLQALLFAIFAAFLLVLLALQQRASGAFFAEFSATEAQEAGHYVTGLMFADYARAHFPPLFPFIETFFLQYPRVALGLNPPLYYLLEGAWFLAVSPSTPAALVLPCLMAAILVVSAGFVTARRLGPLPGVAVCAVLLALTPLRAAILVVSLDMPAALLAFLAALAFWRYLETGGWGAAAGFGLLASAAMLTDFGMVALVLLPPLGVLVARRLPLMRRAGFYLPYAFMLVLAGPWIVGTYPLVAGHFAGGWGLGFAALSASFYGTALTAGLTSLILALAGFGALSALLASWRDRAAGSGLFATLAALAGAVLIGCLVVPLAPDARHLLPAVVPLVMLAAYGGMRLIGLLTTGWPTLSGLMVSMVMLLAALPALLTPLLKPPVGMIPAARAILEQGAAGPLVLVASDEKGEGALIAAIAQQDVARTAVVVPARRLLPAGPVPGMDAQGTARVLSDSAAAFVVLDATSAAAAVPQNGQVRAALEGAPEDFNLLGTYPRADGTGEVRLYAMPQNAARRADPARLRQLLLPRAGG